mmetsp:Transcript_3630/g.9426  ORF Transcript_3630/g.9426 Transcript_3630/m.9426 type:complete len:279 (+) Transcript_3630:541-1377(+)
MRFFLARSSETTSWSRPVVCATDASCTSTTSAEIPLVCSEYSCSHRRPPSDHARSRASSPAVRMATSERQTAVTGPACAGSMVQRSEPAAGSWQYTAPSAQPDSSSPESPDGASSAPMCTHVGTRDVRAAWKVCAYVERSHTRTVPSAAAVATTSDDDVPNAAPTTSAVCAVYSGRARSVCASSSCSVPSAVPASRAVRPALSESATTAAPSVASATISHPWSAPRSSFTFPSPQPAQTARPSCASAITPPAPADEIGTHARNTPPPSFEAGVERAVA